MLWVTVNRMATTYIAVQQKNSAQKGEDLTFAYFLKEKKNFRTEDVQKLETFFIWFLAMNG